MTLALTVLLWIAVAFVAIVAVTAVIALVYVIGKTILDEVSPKPSAMDSLIQQLSVTPTEKKP